jgi:hypothetical protein
MVSAAADDKVVTTAGLTRATANGMGHEARSCVSAIPST